MEFCQSTGFFFCCFKMRLTLAYSHLWPLSSWCAQMHMMFNSAHSIFIEESIINIHKYINFQPFCFCCRCDQRFPRLARVTINLLSILTVFVSWAFFSSVCDTCKKKLHSNKSDRDRGGRRECIWLNKENEKKNMNTEAIANVQMCLYHDCTVFFFLLLKTIIINVI